MNRGAERIIVPSKPSTEQNVLNKVKVLVRIRPSLPNEPSQSYHVLRMDEKGSKNLFLEDPRYRGDAIQYTFDHCYDAHATQDDIFTSQVSFILPCLFQGMNTSIFCTGMTGAGKTYTMQGTRDNPGIIPRTVQSIIDLLPQYITPSKMDQKPNTIPSSIPSATTIHSLGQLSNRLASVHPSRDRTHPLVSKSAKRLLQSTLHPSHVTEEIHPSICLSYFEIYNEKVYDLLQPKDQDCAIREDLDHRIIISNLSEIPIQSFDQFLAVFEVALKNRRTASTKLNHQSSRSHALMMIKVRTREIFPPHRILEGKLYLIDLAGNEDNRRTDNKAMRMVESTNVNSSLFVLAKVVQALNDGEKRIPYRDSKLTRLLQDSLGGNSMAIMIANVAPGLAHFSNTYHTLNFASKSRQIINLPQVVNHQSNSALKEDETLISSTLISKLSHSTCSNSKTATKQASNGSNSTISLPFDYRKSSLDKMKPPLTKTFKSSNRLSYSTHFPHHLTDYSSALKGELQKIQKDQAAQHSKLQKIQYRVDKEAMYRIEQLEKALQKHTASNESDLSNKTSNTTTSEKMAIRPSNSSQSESPTLQNKEIQKWIERARSLEQVDAGEALNLYDQVLSRMNNNGAEYAQLIHKIQTRIDQLLASIMDEQDKPLAFSIRQNRAPLSKSLSANKRSAASPIETISIMANNRVKSSKSLQVGPLSGCRKDFEIAPSYLVNNTAPPKPNNSSTQMPISIDHGTKTNKVKSSFSYSQADVLPIHPSKLSHQGKENINVNLIDQASRVEAIHPPSSPPTHNWIRKQSPETSCSLHADRKTLLRLNHYSDHGDDDSDRDYDQSDQDLDTPPRAFLPHQPKRLVSPPTTDSTMDLNILEEKVRTMIQQELELIEFSTLPEIERILDILNEGNSKTIRQLHGIGKVRADQIVERRVHSPFTALEQLVHVGLRERFILSFVRRNIIESVYFSRVGSLIGSTNEKPICLMPKLESSCGGNT